MVERTRYVVKFGKRGAPEKETPYDQRECVEEVIHFTKEVTCSHSLGYIDIHEALPYVLHHPNSVALCAKEERLPTMPQSVSRKTMINVTDSQTPAGISGHIP